MKFKDYMTINEKPSSVTAVGFFAHGQIRPGMKNKFKSEVTKLLKSASVNETDSVIEVSIDGGKSDFEKLKTIVKSLQKTSDHGYIEWFVNNSVQDSVDW